MNKEEARRLMDKYDSATSKIRNSKAAKSHPEEQEYGFAYQRLVKAGLAMPLKRKYRGR